jgi:small subunit ribosomal protein S17
MAETNTPNPAQTERPHQNVNTDRGVRREIIGLVVSDKMQKTITVQVTRLEKHKKYKKYLRRHTKFYAHDEKREAKVGDTVLIMETRPLSKLKRWRFVKVLAAAGSSGMANAATTKSTGAAH